MTETQKKLIRLGFAGIIFGLIMLSLPVGLLLWVLVIPGAVVIWIGCLVASTYVVSWLEDWLEDRND